LYSFLVIKTVPIELLSHKLQYLIIKQNNQLQTKIFFTDFLLVSEAEKP